MAETCALRRVKKSKIEDNKDFYQTPTEATQALLEIIKKLDIDHRSTVLEPACGKLSIYRRLCYYFVNVTKFDLNFTMRRQNFLTSTKKYDVIIMNPPYGKLKYKFINHARKLAKHVFVFLPMQIVNYNDFHNNYMDIPEFVGKIKMSPKIFLHEGKDLRPGGMSSYGWFYYNSENNYPASIEWYKNLKEIKL
jgi:predicted RNA methylase